MRNETKTSLARLREVLSYDPDTGLFTWLKSTAHRIKVGDVAGCVAKPHGYIVIRLDNVLHHANRLALLFSDVDLTGLDVDHIDGNPGNNELSNLRPVTKHQNMRNSRKRKTTFTSVWKGVSRCHKSDKWIARIYVDGKNLVLGRFADEKEAAEEYMFAALEHFGDYARLQ